MCRWAGTLLHLDCKFSAKGETRHRESLEFDWLPTPMAELGSPARFPANLAMSWMSSSALQVLAGTQV